MESIIQHDKTRCFLCGEVMRKRGEWNGAELHHILFGSNRKFADKEGLTVYLCGETCHRNGKKAPHQNRETDLRLKRIAQERYEETHSRDEWLRNVGRNYL